jgi:hypothetical protein
MFFVVVMIGWISSDVCFIVTGGNGFFSVMIGWISGDVGLL